MPRIVCKGKMRNENTQRASKTRNKMKEDASLIVDEGSAGGGSFGQEPVTVTLSGEGASHVRHYRCSFHPGKCQAKGDRALGFGSLTINQLLVISKNVVSYFHCLGWVHSSSP